MRLAVSCEADAALATAMDLAAELTVSLTDSVAVAADVTHLLVVTAARLELRVLGTDAPGPVYVDFSGGAVAHRYHFGGGRNQPLARAVGLKRGAMPTVLDATAGLGRDAFVLASLGCSVHLVERSPVVAALLRDGLRRAADDPALHSLVTERLRLTVADGRNYLQALAEKERPDVVYLDPMYPHRRKAALTGKEMRVLRQLAGDDDDASELLVAALSAARRRVVVKRPRLAPTLVGPPPGFQIIAPHTRFDMYPMHPA